MKRSLVMKQIEMSPLFMGVLVATRVASAEPASPAVQPADESQVTSSVESSKEAKDIRNEVPNFGYAYTAYGASRGAVGAQAYSLGLVAAGQDAMVGGGGAVWASPFKRLTLIVDAQRNVAKNFSPSAAVIVGLYGNRSEGLSLSGLGKFKIDGFAAGPDHDEVESELEIGFLASFVESGWLLDLNAIAGRGLGDDGETDAEGRLRFARSLGSMFRLGVDGQARARLSGPRTLPNGRTWDFAAGPQAVLGLDNFYGSLTAGPTTSGLTSSNVGWVAMAAVGGTTF
jgi:hypothetical protein